MIIEVYGKLFKYDRIILLEDSYNFEELHNNLIENNYWQGVKYGNYFTYFKYIGAVE